MASTFDASDREQGSAVGSAPTSDESRETIAERSMRLHHRMLQDGPQPFATINMDRRLDYVNDAFCELLGYSRDELIGMSVVDLTDPRYRGATLDSHRQIQETGRGARIVKRYLCKDGRQAPVELLIDAARDDQGGVIGFFAFITEISERVQTQEALAASERRARTIFEGIHDAVLVHDADGRILDANPAACELLGYGRGELTGMDLGRIDDAEFARGFRERLERVTAEGQLTAETTYRAKSGRTIPVEIIASTIEIDGRPAFLTILRDVTERIALERTRRRFAEVQIKSAQALEAKNRELTQSEERYRRLTDGSLDAIVVTDGGGRILMINPSAESVFGYGARQVLGEPLHVLIPSTARVRSEESAPAVFDASDIVNKTVETTGRRRDGTEFPIEISFSQVATDGRVEYVASIRDQTERQRMRAMLAHTDKLASIGLLSAGVAHEINNPLSYVANNLAVLRRDVKGLMEMLVEAEAAATAAERSPEAVAKIAAMSEEIDWPYIRQNLEPMLDRTMEGVRRVANIVQKMRGLARTSRPKWERASLNELIESALEMTRGRLKKDKIEVSIQNRGAECIDCVPTDISQVLLNLLINALQAVEAAGKAEGGRIDIETKTTGEWVEIGVRDNGDGISPDDFGRLFDPFFTTKPVGEGTGLGLAISHGIITGHGGRIEVESEPGRGTCFRILLPKSERARPETTL